MPRKAISIAVVMGLVLGIVLFFSPGSLFFIFLTFVTVVLINRITDKKEKNFILKLFLWGFGARIFFALLLALCLIYGGRVLNYGTSSSYLGRNYPNFSTPYLFDDEGYYTLRAQYTNMHWFNKPLSDITIEGIIQNEYGFTSFVYVLAWYFAIFGYSPISSRFINCFLGVFIAIIVYSIVKNIFGEKPAKLSSIFVAFFPSIFIWSITNLKESIFIFTVYLMLWALVKFVKAPKIYYLVIILASMLFQFTVRKGYRELVMLTIVVLLFYFLLLFATYLYKKRMIVLLIFTLVISACFISAKANKINAVLDDVIYRSIVMHKGATSYRGAINYKLLSDEEMDRPIISRGRFIKMLAMGWFHMMLEPLPSSIKTPAMLASSFLTVLWYPLIPFSLSGIFLSLRYRFKESFILVLYFLLMGSALAVSGGNIGTTFRLRDTITPIFLIFSCVGIINTFTKSKLYLEKEINSI